MSNWKRARIGDLCEIIKGETGLASAPPGEYPLVATGADRRSCTTWQFDTDAVCIPLVSSTGHGKKTLNYVHYQSGKFALGTILAAVIPKDPSVLTARFLHLYLSHFKDTVLVPLMKGAANVSLSMKEIASVKIPVPPLDEQQSLIDLIFRIEDEHQELLTETNHQGVLLKQLRQALLQEAVAGELTTAWRKQHPVAKGDPQYDAAALLAQIKAEKERLVKEGKIRKEKPLPPITDEDKPFDLPEGWGWCRLGEVADGFQYGSSVKSLKEGKVPVLRMGNIQCGKIDWSNLVYTNDTGEIRKYRVTNGDLLFNRTNSRELVGKTGLFDGMYEAIFAGYLVRVTMLGGISATYSNGVLNSKFHREWCDANKTDALGQSNINATKLRDYFFPLPPLAEQQAIVARVDSLMATIDELEKQVAERKEQAQLLMQTVLREAFDVGQQAGTVIS
ncbi:restriction endonuclease subunit S [Trichlorobacter lovleyi]|uniref:Restriction modification system DNA specificity domain n=1 Tax=Trichlorobacter lovleyi (strain ATCC BAA-1151 / DSM 17278 / SZ) TaxID=398767 RepID=B3E898_TRIL1|nr:restriction endonuclease subunit S [Trichlorobacter lovleyi]ACD95135.1 restriction modification system DNA specificity domain [Trichlorobacter lovleyi SZ]